MVDIKRYKKYIRVIFVGVLLIIVACVFQSSVLPAIGEIQSTDPDVTGLVLVISLLFYSIEGIITYIMAERYVKGFPMLIGVACSFYSCFYRAVTFGSGSGIAEIFYLSKYGVPVPKATGISLMKYAVHKVSLVICCGIYVFLDFTYIHSNYRSYIGYLIAGYVLTFLVGSFIFFLCLSPRLYRWIYKGMDFIAVKFPKASSKLSQGKHQLALMQQESAGLVKDVYRLYSLFIFNVVKFTLIYMIPYVILHQKYGITMLDSLATTSLIAVLASVIPSPAGIGSTEFVYVLLFSETVGDVAALSSALLYRVATFIFPFLVGGLGIIVARLVRFSQRRERE